MTRLVHTRRVDVATLDVLRRPRTDALLAERLVTDGEPSDATVVHTLDAGPFTAYRREVRWDRSPGDDGLTEVTETWEYQLAAPFWRFLLAIPVRRALRRGPLAASPWWAPPDRFDAATASSVALLCIAAVMTGYLGAVIGQTATFATDEFDASDGAQGLLLAAVRIGALVTVVIMTLADRHGRRRLLVVSMLAGCGLTLLGAASPNLVALGVSQAPARGFATAITLLIGIMAAEIAPRSSRAYLAALLTLTAGLGAGIPVWFLFLADLDERGWRLLYLIALLFVPVAVWIGRNLPESARFRTHVAQTTDIRTDARTEATARYTDVRRDRLIAYAAVAFLVLMFAAPASQFRNEFLRDERGFTAAQVSLFVVAANTPQGIGVAIAGKIADRRGRKPVAVFTVAVGALCTVLTYVFSGGAMWAAAIAAGIIASGAAPSLGVYGAELFGTGGRGRANGVVSVIAVLGSATGLVLVGLLADRFDFGTAFAILAVGPMLVVAIVLRFYPESANRELEELNPGDRGAAAGGAP